MDIFADASAFERTLFDRAAQTQTPIYTVMELSPLCNMNCDMCYVRLSQAEMERIGRLRTADEWLNMARQMRDAGTLFLLLTGGEPLLFPDFRRFYRDLLDLGMMVAINTNGTLIDEDWARFFGQYKPRRINITLYGPNEEAYENLCHYGAGYERTINAIRLLREQGVEVRVSLTITRENAPHLPRLIEMVHELGAAILTDSYVMPVTRERTLPFNEQSRLLPEEAAAARLFALRSTMPPPAYVRMLMEQLYLVKNPLPQDGPLHPSCRAGVCSCMINWQGELRPCVALSEPSFPAFEMGFAAAWQQLHQQFTQLVLSSRCAQCRLRPVCLVCAASAISETGSIDGTPEYMCRHAAHSMRIMIDQLRKLPPPPRPDAAPKAD